MISTATMTNTAILARGPIVLITLLVLNTIASPMVIIAPKRNDSYNDVWGKSSQLRIGASHKGKKIMNKTNNQYFVCHSQIDIPNLKLQIFPAACVPLKQLIAFCGSQKGRKTARNAL
jgi:hypothetical protein